MTAAKFYVYRNLRTRGFSIKHKGKVIERNDFFIAEDVEFRVSEVSRQRVILEKQKNVHAYSVCDKYISASNKDAASVDKLSVITYNPYVAGYFVCNQKRITYAKRILFSNGKCYLLEI